MTDDFEEYEALEAEAEALSQPKQNPIQAPNREVRKAPAQNVPQRASAPQVQQAPAREEEERAPRYIAMHIPERIFIMDTQTEAAVAEGFKDDGAAMAYAKIMNDLDTIIVNGGFQQ